MSRRGSVQPRQNSFERKFLLHFYRAMRMHSANYAVARCLSVFTSVCPSHAGVVSKRLYPQSLFTIGYPDPPPF